MIKQLETVTDETEIGVKGRMGELLVALKVDSEGYPVITIINGSNNVRISTFSHEGVETVRFHTFEQVQIVGSERTA